MKQLLSYKFMKIATCLPAMIFVVATCEQEDISPVWYETRKEENHNNDRKKGVTSGSTSNLGPYFDWSGDVKILIKTVSDDNCQKCRISADLPADYVSGAETTLARSDRSTLLNKAYSNFAGDSFFTESKDQLREDPHSLTAYAIGL